jgi:hypothetical protein
VDVEELNPEKTESLWLISTNEPKDKGEFSASETRRVLLGKIIPAFQTYSWKE